MAGASDYLILAACGAGVYLIFHIVTRIRRSIRVRNFKREHGCQPAREYPQPEKVVGYHLLKEIKTSIAEGQYLQNIQERAEKVGSYTYTSTTISKDAIITADPENIKAILSTKFKDFCLGPRDAGFGPLIGKGIFTAEGRHWEHSRVS